jgi:hypothetical protein
MKRYPHSLLYTSDTLADGHRAAKRYRRLSKADLMDVFADMAEQFMGEGITGKRLTREQILSEAERRLEIVKLSQSRPSTKDR